MQQFYTELTSLDEVHALVSSVCAGSADAPTAVTDLRKLQEEVVYTLAFNVSVYSDTNVKQAAIRAINSIATLVQIRTSSNAAFYDEKAAGKHQFFTVPAINLRMVTFHTCRAALRAAAAHKLPHIIFELAISEMGYTGQHNDEFAALVKAAYISLGFQDTIIYLQADHYQLDPKKYAENADTEVQRVKDVIVKALEAGIYNIDIDSSKFETADPAKSDRENQKENARLSAELFHFIRSYEKEHSLPCTVSIGGEVGEVGGEHTRYPAVNAYLALLKEYAEALGSGEAKGLSKISINVGSAHGGVLGPDGQPLDTVPLDFTAHHDVFMLGKDEMSGAPHVLSVQHGASTLPKHYFPLFPAMHVAEIHLATGFQNLVWEVIEKEDGATYEKMKSIMLEKFADKIASHETEAVGFMKERKRVTEFVKKDLLLSPAIPAIEKALEQEFFTIFHSLYTLLKPQKMHVEAGDRAD